MCHTFITSYILFNIYYLIITHIKISQKISTSVEWKKNINIITLSEQINHCLCVISAVQNDIYIVYRAQKEILPMLYTIEMLYRSMGKITSLEIINDHDVLIKAQGYTSLVYA